MSIALMALQFLTVKMLRGQTLAGEVYANPIDPLDEAHQRIARGVLAVVVGEDKRAVTGRAFNDGERRVELSIQAFFPESIRVEFDGEPIKVEGRGAGGELAMAILWRQIERQMMAGQTPAALLWRRLVTRVFDVVSTPYLFEVRKGLRLVARETTYTLEVVDDPGFTDDDLPPLWGEICDLLDEDDDYAPVSAWIRSELVVSERPPHHDVVAADQGLSREAVAAIGEAPVLDHAEPGDDAAELSSITLDPLGVTEAEPEPGP